MNGSILTVRLLLALVFLVAALGKLADREGSRDAVGAFGVPERLAGTVADLLPLLELAAAILLVASATARIGAALATVLLVAFSVGIARSIARSETPDCHCFGQLHSAPAGPKTLGRNLLLAAAAAFVLVSGPGTSATAWVGALSGTEATALIAGVVIVIAIAALGAFALSMLRRHGHLLLRIEALEQALAAHGIAVPSIDPVAAPELVPAPGLPVGTPAPELEIPGLEGEPVTLRSLRTQSRDIVLLFTDPSCGPCSALLPQIASWQQDHGQSLRIVLVSRGGRDANIAHAREHGLVDVLVQADREVSERYGVSGTPSAVVVAADGTIASAVHVGAEAIRSLVATRLAAPTLTVHRHEPRVGQPAPDATLRTLDGEERTLSSSLAGPTAVLFWNPSCGFCERMLPELQRFDAVAPADAPGLLLISTGDPQQNREMGLRAPILLDDSFAAGSAFGASGTPSAVLVDGDGRIASPVAVGAAAVLELVGAGGAAVASR